MTPADPSTEALQLFQAHGAALYRFCCVTLGRAEEAEDVVQEAFLKLLQHLQQRGERSNLRAWLFTVAANGCRDRIRWRVRWVPWRADLDLRAVDAGDDEPGLRAARMALRKLAPRDRMLLTMRSQGLSYREIAAVTGIRETSVGRLIAREAAVEEDVCDVCLTCSCKRLQTTRLGTFSERTQRNARVAAPVSTGFGESPGR